MNQGYLSTAKSESHRSTFQIVDIQLILLYFFHFQVISDILLGLHLFDGSGTTQDAQTPILNDLRMHG